MTRQVVITGMGMTTPVGGDVATSWANVLAGRPGISAITEEWVSDQPSKIAGFMAVDPEWISHLHDNVAAPERCPKPVIAQLHGYCLGVGLELALACDFRIAADDTQIGLPEISLGMIPGSGGSQRIVQMVGVGRAKDMVMRGRRLKADEALRWGLLTEVHPRAELDAAVAALADDMAARPAVALRTLKRVLNQAPNAPLAIGMELEGLAYGLLRSTEDFAEGVSAFTEKRKPEWRDR